MECSCQHNITAFKTGITSILAYIKKQKNQQNCNPSCKYEKVQFSSFLLVKTQRQFLNLIFIKQSKI